jgi:hypothetical protein
VNTASNPTPLHTEVELVANPVEGVLSQTKFTGIAWYSQRSQPYTVWVRGESVLFCVAELEARQALAPEVGDGASKAIVRWVSKREGKVREALAPLADSPDEEALAEEHVEAVVEKTLEVERTEPRFREIVTAVRTLAHEDRTRRAAPRRAPQVRQRDRQTRVAGANDMPSREANRISFAADTGSKHAASRPAPDAPIPPPGANAEIWQSPVEDPLTAIETELRSVLSRPFMQLLRLIPFTGVGDLYKLQRRLRASRKKRATQ